MSSYPKRAAREFRRTAAKLRAAIKAHAIERMAANAGKGY